MALNGLLCADVPLRTYILTSLSPRGLYDPLSESRLMTALSNYRLFSMPVVLVAGATVTQNSPFSSLVVNIAIASAHCAYPRRDGQAELTWVAGIY